MLEWILNHISSSKNAKSSDRLNASNSQINTAKISDLKSNIEEYSPPDPSKPSTNVVNHAEQGSRVRMRGRTIDPHQMLDDGLGDHARGNDASPLTCYKQFSPGGYYNQELRQHQTYQQQKYHSQSQFYPNEMNDYNLRRCSTAANPELSSNVYTPTAATMAVVHPENSRRCYSTASSNSVTKKLSKRLSMSTTVPSFKDENIMRGHSIDKHDTAHNYSDTPRTTRPLNSNHRHLSQSHVDYLNHAKFRQNLRPLAENSSTDSATTGSQYSQPRKPTSVVELPSAPIQPQFYSSNAQYQKSNNEHPHTPTNFDISHNFQPLKSSTPRHYDGHEWVTPSQQFFGATTTFGTEPQRKSTYIADNNAFSPDEFHTRQQSLSAEILTEKSFDGISPEREENNIIHSPMSNSGHSSSAATTTTTDTIMPTFFNNGPSNKVAVAPQPQKRSNRHSSTAKEEIPRFRTQVTHSPYQMNSHSSSNGITASRSGQRLNRMSSEVFIDGPPPTTPDGHTDVRVSLLEDKIRSIESELNGRAVSNSRQNMVFSAPSEAQRLMMNEIIEKDMLIGQLKSRIQILSARSERQQLEFDEGKILNQTEIMENRNRYLTVKKKLQQVTEQLNSRDKIKDEELNKIAKELSIVKEQIRLRDQEISALKTRLAASADGELIKLREELRTKEHINTELQDELVNKNSKIKQLERLIDDLQNRSASSSLNSSTSCIKPKSDQPPRGSVTLTEVDTEEDEDLFRRDLTTPTPTSKSMHSLSSVTGQSDERISFSPSFNNLIRTLYRRTQICHGLGKDNATAISKMLDGKRTEAGRLLGYITDTEGDDSEAVNSETTLTNSKMSMVTAERFLRKECDMMNQLEKSLNEQRVSLIEICQKGQTIVAKNPDCRIQ